MRDDLAENVTDTLDTQIYKLSRIPIKALYLNKK